MPLSVLKTLYNVNVYASLLVVMLQVQVSLVTSLDTPSKLVNSHWTSSSTTGGTPSETVT